jgi:predicted dehydrogenase
MSALTRRDFTKLIGAAGIAALTPTRNILGANNDIRIAVIGVGGQGWNHAKRLRKMDGVRLVAVCDPDSATVEKRINTFKQDGITPKVEGYQDFHKVLDDKDIDAVVIATPNHWHSLMTIYACQAGKDVYVEKPVSHTIWEGRKLCEAAEKYGRIVQGGTQNRSDVGLLEFFDWFKEGHLGKIKSLHGLCYRNRTGIGQQDTPLIPPASLDYNLWLGPAQDLAMYRPRLHYDWHWIWNTGNGDVGNQAPHEYNLLAWAIGDRVLPKRVTTFGGRFGWHDAGETPNTQFVMYEFECGIPVYFEVRNMRAKPDVNTMPLYTKYGKTKNCNIIIDCENGFFQGTRGGGFVYDTDGKRGRQFKGDGGANHMANFLDAMRSRKTSDLRSPVETNHYSDCWHHMANVAYRLGKSVGHDELKERMSADKVAMETFERCSQQMRDWKIDHGKEPWTLGTTLTFDTEKEQFTGPMAKQANVYLHRRDRPAFRIPNHV